MVMVLVITFTTTMIYLRFLAEASPALHTRRSLSLSWPMRNLQLLVTLIGHLPTATNSGQDVEHGGGTRRPQAVSQFPVPIGILATDNV